MEDAALEIGLVGMDAVVFNIGLIALGVIVLALAYAVLRWIVR